MRVLATAAWTPLAAAALLARAILASEPVAVIACEATVVGFPLTVEALGTARANESVEIRPQLSETLVAVNFDEGQRVEKRTVLAELQNSQALAAVAVARAVLLDSEGQYRRAEQLFKTRALSASELEQREARRDADSATLTAAEARLAETVIRAPFAGRVGLRRVSPGSYVTPDTIITTLDDSDVIKLDFDVAETALGLLAKGLAVEARSAAYRDHVFEGEVSAIDTRVDPISRTVTVRALLQNQDGRLRAGMFLSVKLLRREVQALVVPEQALVPEQSSQFVFVIGAEERVEKREVRTGRRRPGQVEIVSGLAAGERVVAEGTQKVQPGGQALVVGTLAIAGETAATEGGAIAP